MHGQYPQEPGTLVELDRDECFALLDTQALGRVAYTDHALPAITPVNYALLGNSVVFRAAVGSQLAEGTRDAVVAFEVDEADPGRREGWSVVIVGMATALTGADEVRALELALAPWPGGPHNQFVKITPTYVTGRRVVTRSAASG